MAWYVPFLIFLARICDVPLGTIRMILVVQGHRWVSAILGFFEVMIWALAVGGVIAYLTNPFALVGYAAGFACGTLIGMSIEDRIAIGHRIVRVFNTQPDRNISQQLWDRGYRVTRVEGLGKNGPVEIAFMVTRRKNVAAIRKAVMELAPEAYITLERCDRPSGGTTNAALAGTLNGESGVTRKAWGRMALVRK
ncbi:MAG: DUF5698 domain-containing protein [Planctomycetota bacterium]|nr:DUF5698 domain-containing protein [Planctomycetota bacterium]